MICSKLDSPIKIEPLAMKFKTLRRLPIFLQPTHLANFATAESSTVTVVESASQTGVFECISHPS